MVSVIIVIIVIAAVIFQSWRKSAGKREKSGPQDPARTAQTSYRTDDRVRKTPKKSSAAASVPRRKAEPKENILTAAKENTLEVAVGNDLDAIVSEQLMDNVYDVMVKGPKDTLTFSRDFVAEATDMLNRYATLP